MSDLIPSVKSYWPNYVITKENVLTPSSEFVTKFYKNFLEELVKLIYKVTGTRLSFGLKNKEYEPQILTYLKMSKVFSFKKAKFTLYDVLNPTSKRTEIIIVLCMDVLRYFQSLLDEPAITNILQIRKELSLMTERKESIREEINTLSQENGILVDKIEKFKARIIILRIQSSEEIRKKTSTKKDHEILVTNIKKLALDNKSLEYELVELQNKCTQLSKLTISEKEYEDLQNKLKNLQKEEGSLKKIIESESEQTEQRTHLFEKMKKILPLVENYSLPIHHLEELREMEKKMEEGKVIFKKQREELESLQKVKEVLFQRKKNLTEQSKNENNTKLLCEKQQECSKIKDIAYQSERKHKKELQPDKEKKEQLQNVITKDTNDLNRCMEAFAKEVSCIEEFLRSLQLPVELKKRYLSNLKL